MIEMNMNIQNLMREAQKMQKNLEKTQKELSDTILRLTSGEIRTEPIYIDLFLPRLRPSR